MHIDIVNGLFDLLERPSIRWALLFFLFVAILSIFSFDGGSLETVLAGLGLEPPLTGVVIVFALAALLTANVIAVSRLPFKYQVVIYWLELLGLFLAFFYSFDLSYRFIVERLPLLLLTGVFYTLFVTTVSIVIASLLALLGALARLSRSGPAYTVATFYVSFFRGTPLLLQVYLIYLGLPQMGLTLDAIPSGIAALSLCYGAYMTEIFRSGIESVPRGQREAAAAIGLKNWQIMLKVVLPQAIRLIIPPTGNNFISMLKDSSLVSAMGVMELMYLARTLGRSEFRHFEMLITAALIYWAISFLFELGQARLERRFAKETR